MWFIVISFICLIICIIMLAFWGWTIAGRAWSGLFDTDQNKRR